MSQRRTLGTVGHGGETPLLPAFSECRGFIEVVVELCG